MPSHPPAVARVLRQVTETARDHEMFAPGDRVLVAVSGGPDSLCLLAALVRLRRLFEISLGVFHFDHCLRDNSADDAEVVQVLAEGLELPFLLRTASDAPAPGDSVEDWAHRARTSAYASAREETGATSVAVGHTRDDQAEQVLIGLLRGEPQRMAGLPPVSGRFIVRPLLEVPRTEIEAMNEALQVQPLHDPMNDDVSILRNAIRHEILPTIERAAGRDPRPTMARVADILRQDQSDLWVQARGAAGVLLEIDANEVRINATALAVLPSPLSSRVVLEAFHRARRAPTEELVAAVLDLAAGRPGRGIDLGTNARATRDRGYIHIPFAKD